ncbi:hypothetical protein L1887_28371 [Cichorium endivia]|nr:hypothetical protein L1887_28371 [Cichorium endivia]
MSDSSLVFGLKKGTTVICTRRLVFEPYSESPLAGLWKRSISCRRRSIRRRRLELPLPFQPSSPSLLPRRRSRVVASDLGLLLRFFLSDGTYKMKSANEFVNGLEIPTEAKAKERVDMYELKYLRFL